MLISDRIIDGVLAWCQQRRLTLKTISFEFFSKTPDILRVEIRVVREDGLTENAVFMTPREVLASDAASVGIVSELDRLLDFESVELVGGPMDGNRTYVRRGIDKVTVPLLRRTRVSWFSYEDEVNNRPTLIQCRYLRRPTTRLFDFGGSVL